MTCCTWTDASEEAMIRLYKISEQTSYLKKMILSMWSFFDLFDSD